jgi:hypothetical protein
MQCYISRILYGWLQHRGMRKEEPLDDELITAEPSSLKTSVIMLLNEDVFTPKGFMDELSFGYNLSLEPEEVEFLLDLPDGTLKSSVGMQLGISSSLDSVTAQYVDVRIDRKKSYWILTITLYI